MVSEAHPPRPGASARVAICVYRAYIEPACERGLRELEEAGWVVWRERGSAAIDRERSRLATAALDQGFDALLWVDSDQTFQATAAETLDAAQAPFISALVARRRAPDFTHVFEPDTLTLQVGEAGGVIRIRYAGSGFCLVRRSAFEAVAQRFGLPRTSDPSGEIVPYYLPMVAELSAGKFGYLGEDYAFCERLRQAGISILLDTRPRIGHLGEHEYGWDDVAHPRNGSRSLTLSLKKP